MEKEKITDIVRRQREYFNTGKTLPVARRKSHLMRLQQSIEIHEEEILAALKKDLGKSRFEGYMCEVGLVKSELAYMLRHIDRLVRDRRVATPLAQFAARSFVRKSPYGVALVMSPWNYPFMLSLDPVVDAIAAGNTVVLKPSNYSPHTSMVLQEIVRECFDERMVAVVTGGRQENQALLEEKFDYIFFTGSQGVGKDVMKKGAEHLTPVTLELGGKSPCIVDGTADIDLAARRIVFGKFLNCGQTCVAPDYVLCHRSVKGKFVDAVIREVARQFGSRPLENLDYGKIINEKHFTRLLGLIDKDKVVCGGNAQPDKLRIAPTVLSDVTWEDAVMQDEIFGPILPILSFDNIEEVIDAVQRRQRPLALYLFSASRRHVEEITQRCSYGGGCINDVVIHLATSNMGFGGVGESGMGAYHGKVGFDTFSHHKSIVDKKNWMDLPMRYQPYTERNRKLVRMFLR